MPLPKYKPLVLKEAPEHVRERLGEEWLRADPDEVMRKFLARAKKDPCLLSSWEFSFSFEEACERYGVE